MTRTPKKIGIFGATGAIGSAALDVIRRFRDNFQVIFITTNTRVKRLMELSQEFKPQACVIASQQAAKEHASELERLDSCKLYQGAGGLEEVIDDYEMDLMFMAISDQASLMPTYKAAEKGIDIALASKEAMLLAGGLLLEAASSSGSTIIPVDSEICALHQLVRSIDPLDLKGIIITGSGGPFKDQKIESLDKITPEMALDHPVWQMGPKISVDSATWMNKVFEIIEACLFFDLEPSMIKVMIQPQSLIHALLLLKDGVMISHVAPADMRSSVAYALFYPLRASSTVGNEIDLNKPIPLYLEPVAGDKHSTLSLASEAFSKGTSGLITLCTTNSMAVNGFLSGRIPFNRIVEITRKQLQDHQPQPVEDIQAVMQMINQTKYNLKELQ